MRAWLVAARPATLPASMSPVLVGCGLAAADGVFRWDAAIVTLASALLLNVAANFANDASDHARGADDQRVGPPRAVAGGLLTARQVWIGTAIVLAAAAGGGIYLAVISGWLIIGIGLASILALLAYTGGPWPYGYHALGEIAVFLFFGFAAVVGSRYAHDATIPAAAWLLAVPIGALITAVLVANNIRDLDTDRASGKRTLAVIVGRRGTRVLFGALVAGAFAWVAVCAAVSAIPTGALAALVAIPLAVGPVLIVTREVDPGRLIIALKATARLGLVFSALLAVGVAL